MPQVLKLFKNRVKVGIHIGPDYTAQPTEVEGKGGVKLDKYPTRTFTTNQTFLDICNMSQKHGSEKFEFLGEATPAVVEEIKAELAVEPPAEDAEDQPQVEAHRARKGRKKHD